MGVAVARNDGGKTEVDGCRVIEFSKSRLPLVISSVVDVLVSPRIFAELSNNISIERVVSDSPEVIFCEEEDLVDVRSAVANKRSSSEFRAWWQSLTSALAQAKFKGSFHFFCVEDL